MSRKPNHSKKRKKLIAISVTVVLAAVLAVGLWLFIQYKNDQKTVEVLPVSQVSEYYFADQSVSSGKIVSDYVQELYPDSSKVISEVFVREGQEVQIGDPLLQYDKTELEIDVQTKELAVKQADLNIDTAQKQLRKLQNTKPVSTAKPTTSPTKKPTARPTSRPSSSPAVTPTPTPAATPTPTPTPVPTPDVTLYSRLDADSIPYQGTGTTEDPYVFLCTSDCTMTPEFLKRLFGIEPEQTPTPEPGEEPDGDGSDEGDGDNPAEDEEPTPIPEPDFQLTSPFAAVFEVRDGNSNYGKLISSFRLDGTQLSANFQLSDAISANTTLDSIATLFGATPTPTPNPDNYNYMGYTRAELNELISQKKQEIRDLQHSRKQAQLDLERADLQLKNSTVLSSVDGTVRTLIDLEAATAEGKPFLVVSGDSTYYVSGALPENLIGSVQIGDEVTFMDYMTGNNYSAQIVSISDYPLEANSELQYYGSGNPNSSSYEFVAVVDQGDGLQSGQYVDITLNVQDEESVDSLFILNAYIREDDAGSYVMKAGIDNRLVKQYVETGRSLYGSSTEIKSGLTSEDYIAFPYGPDVKEGVRVRLQGSEEGPMGGDDSLPTLGVGSLPESSASSDSGSETDSDFSFPEEDGEESGNDEALYGETGEAGESDVSPESGSEGGESFD